MSRIFTQALTKLQLAIIIVIIVIAVVGGAIAALYRPTPPTLTPSPTLTPTPTVMTPTPTTPPTTSPVVERILRVSFANVPYPDPAVGSDEASSNFLANVYDTLVYVTPNLTIIPWVAEKWDVSSDGLTWTFYLRKGVKFHVTGREMTADDVYFSLLRLITIGEGYAYLLAPYVDMNKTKVVDQYTIQIVLKKPYGAFLWALLRLYIVDSELVKQHIKRPGPYGEWGDFGREWLMSGEKDAGSGPYMIKEYRRGEAMILQRYKDWWNAKAFAPNAPDIVIMYGFTDPSTIRTLMARRELEITDQWQPLENYEWMVNNIKYVELAKLPGSSEFYLMLNSQKPPLDDIHVRKALAYAFDYETAIKQINPYEKRAITVAPSALLGWCAPPENITYDPQKAIEELKKSKYWGQFDKYPIDYWWVAEVPWEERVALLFKSNVEGLGVGLKVNVIKMPWLSVVEALSKVNTSPHIVSIFVQIDYPEVGSMLMNRYHSKTYGTWMQNEWLYSYQPQLDRMIEDAVATLNNQERYAKYCQVMNYIFNLYPSIYLYEHTTLKAYQAYYVDWPAAKGNAPYLILGLDLEYWRINVYPEKRAELLK
jgi:peptide/nickel transport system substrate-binding protein